MVVPCCRLVPGGHSLQWPGPGSRGPVYSAGPGPAHNTTHSVSIDCADREGPGHRAVSVMVIMSCHSAPIAYSADMYLGSQKIEVSVFPAPSAALVWVSERIK